MLRRFKETQAARADERTRAHLDTVIAQLADESRRAQEAWEAAKLEHGEDRVQGIAMKKGEVAYLVLDGVGLVEPRRAPGQWVGASHGVSFKIAKGVRYRVGQTRGTYQQGEERPQVIDTGLGVITNQRIVFVGSQRTTEWAFAKLVGFSLEHEGMAIFNVSNRQKASGLAYQPAVDHVVDAVVAATVAQYRSPEEHAEVVAEMLSIYKEAYANWAAAAAPPTALPPPPPAS